MTTAFPAFLSFCVGFLSLSLEILWVRAIGFAFNSTPQAFAFVLTFYLFGIAIGAAIGKEICARYARLYLASGIVLLASAMFDLIAPELFAASVRMEHLNLVVAAVATVGTALLKSILFPIAHHLGTSRDASRVGRSVSRVYFCNVIGSTLGPLVTGFFLIDVISLQSSFVLIAWLTLVLAVACFLREYGWHRARVAILLPVLVAPIMARENNLPVRLGDRLKGHAVKAFHENKHGIITIYDARSGGDIVFGGNVYDGRTNLDPIVNSNSIERALILSTLHPSPRRILMIGLSTGAWLKLVTSFPKVETIEVVEINPGYIEVIRNYPQIAAALLDNRVTVHVDDGRRWLRNNPNARFDLVIMNTTWHWRAYATNLLSAEFLELVRGHMNAGAIISYNATGSGDAFKTAASVFPYAYRYANFIYAGDQDFRGRLDTPEARDTLRALTLDGQPLFSPDDPRASDVVETFIARPFVEFSADQQLADRQYRVITDRNMLTEFRYGKHLVRPPDRILRIFRPEATAPAGAGSANRAAN